jgi:hypothetical protein
MPGQGTLCLVSLVPPPPPPPSSNCLLLCHDEMPYVTIFSLRFARRAGRSQPLPSLGRIEASVQPMMCDVLL